MSIDTYNVKAFGAKGDGINDDTIFIQNAINAAGSNNGGVVIFPIGQYKITSSLYVYNLANITLQGTTNAGTYICPDFLSGICISLYKALGFAIKNLVLNAPTSPTPTSLVGIYCYKGAYMGLIDTFYIYNFNVGIQVDTGVNDLTISNGIIVSTIADNYGIKISADTAPQSDDKQRIDIVQIRSVTINQSIKVNDNTFLYYGIGIYAGQGLNTLRLDNVGLIGNVYGLVATAPNPDQISGPLFIIANDLEVDFSQNQNIYLDQGKMFVASNLYLQGAQQGCLAINPGFTQTAISTARILPSAGAYAIYSQTDSVTISTSFIRGSVSENVTQNGNLPLIV